PGGTLELDVNYTTDHGIEGAGLDGAILNVAAVNPAATGYLTVYPDDSARPGTSNVNFVRGRTIANQVITRTGLSSGVKIYNGSSGTVDVVADLSGWFGSFGIDSYVAVTPYRALDTRQRGGPLPPRSSTMETLPDQGTDGLVLNATVTDTKAD